MPVILHVEDDPAIAALVLLSFENLGFRGNTVTAASVRDAEKILDEHARAGKRFDLILSDMSLPDGTGLDLVRYVRSTPPWKTTPMLMLSSDENPKTVSRAYALGANAYVSKSPPGRTINHVVNALYQHWVKDVVPTTTKIPDDLYDAFSRAMTIRLQHARLYERLAEKFSSNPSESAFWLSRALGESNMINVLGFVQGQLVNHDLDEELIGEIEDMQNDIQRRLSSIDQDLDSSSLLSRDDIYLRVLQLVSTPNVELVARSMARLFPVIPVATATLRDFLLGSIQDMTAWVDLHTNVPAIRERALQLREAAATFPRT